MSPETSSIKPQRPIRFACLRPFGLLKSDAIFFVTNLEMKNLQNQIDCRQPLNEGWLRWEPGFGTL